VRAADREGTMLTNTAQTLSAIYGKISSMLNAALKEKKPQVGSKSDKTSDPKHALMDLCASLASAATPDIAAKLLQQGMSDTLLSHRDGTLQKKTYKMLNQLFEGAEGKKLVAKGLEDVIEKLCQGTTTSVSSAAKKVGPLVRAATGV
jgi:hypothetical protein